MSCKDFGGTRISKEERKKIIVKVFIFIENFGIHFCCSEPQILSRNGISERDDSINEEEEEEKLNKNL